jgi:uncharacterized membrane protein HdeD (DUF308 family)
MIDPYGDAALEAAAFKTFKRMALAGAVASIIMGLVLLIWPDKTLALLAALIGVWLCVVGIVRIAEAFVTKGMTKGARALTALAGVLYLVIGIICLSNLLGSITVLAVVLGIVWVIGGAIEMVTALTRANGWGKASGLLLGLLSLLAGLVLLFWPERSLTVLVWILGLWLLAIGIIQLILALTAHRAGTRIPGNPLMGT